MDVGHTLAPSAAGCSPDCRGRSLHLRLPFEEAQELRGGESQHPRRSGVAALRRGQGIERQRSQLRVGGVPAVDADDAARHVGRQPRGPDERLGEGSPHLAGDAQPQAAQGPAAVLGQGT